MTPEQLELYDLLRNQEAPFGVRYGAALLIAGDAVVRRIDAADIRSFYRSMVEFWRGLGVSKTDRDNDKLFSARIKLANVCRRLSLQLPEGQKCFEYYPRVKRAEGHEGRISNTVMRGALKTVYGTSLYEFHWEYPIEGFGIRKDLIAVITDDNERIPLLDWCGQNDIIIFCNRCGLDITYEVSKDCPFAKLRLIQKS